MISKETIYKVLANVKNDQMLKLAANYISNTASDTVICSFIEACLCNNNEVKSFIKTEDDFNKMKILEVIDKLEPARCITNIIEIRSIDWLNRNIIVKYNYYDVTYHANMDYSDMGVCIIDDTHKYSKIHTDVIHVAFANISYKDNDILV